jgi:two-component system, chemotaxis family, chemotaxis protein CheY
MARMMVVDDALNMRMIMRDLLQGAGHEVVGEAANGEEAVEKYKELRPDLVTMDLTMPLKDGVEALREIREFDPTAKIIMCSAIGHKQAVLEAIMAGAKDFILKPLQKEKVLDAIRRALL